MTLCVFLFHLCSTGTPSSGPAAIGTPSIDSPCRNWSESFKQGRKQRMGGLFSGCLNHWKLRNTCGKQDTEKHTIMQCCKEQVEKMIRHFYPTPTPTSIATTAANNNIQRICTSVCFRFERKDWQRRACEPSGCLFFCEALRWTGTLPRVSPGLQTMTVGTGFNRPMQPLSAGWMHGCMDRRTGDRQRQ